VVSGNSSNGPSADEPNNYECASRRSGNFQFPSDLDDKRRRQSSLTTVRPRPMEPGTPVNSGWSRNHQLAITNLTIGTLYHFRARSTDANNNSSVSGDMTVRKLAGDTVAPTVSITSPAANATLSGTVNVAVTASDNVGVASVQLKIDNANSGAACYSGPFVISVNTLCCRMRITS